METHHSRVRWGGRNTLTSYAVFLNWSSSVWTFPSTVQRTSPQKKNRELLCSSWRSENPEVRQVVGEPLHQYNDEILEGLILFRWCVCICLPQKRRRWGALHVCIAWKIYHHKQLKVSYKGPDAIDINAQGMCTGLWSKTTENQTPARFLMTDVPVSHVLFCEQPQNRCWSLTVHRTPVSALQTENSAKAQQSPRRRCSRGPGWAPVWTEMGTTGWV